MSIEEQNERKQGTKMVDRDLLNFLLACLGIAAMCAVVSIIIYFTTP